MTPSSAHSAARAGSPAAVLIGASNSLAVLGVPWGTALRWARELGVPLIRPSARKILVRSDLLIAALERRQQIAVALGDDPTVIVRRALGGRRRA